MEESIRQGGLSAILYAQHAGKTIENCENLNLGTMMGSQHVPAVGWQDDITILAEDNEMEKRIVDSVIKTAKEERIVFSKEKCKYIIIGNKKHNFEETKFEEAKLEKVEK